MRMVGIDEAGRGPVLGPLVFGICSVPISDEHLLMEQGVKDSKMLSRKKRQDIEQWFWSEGKKRGWYGTTISHSPERIDLALQDKGLNWLEVEGFREALHALPVQTDLSVIADACDVNAERFTQRICDGLDGWPWPNTTLTSEHKADDNHLIVAMASILAKEERDRAVARLGETTGVVVGSGYPSDPTTKQALHHLCTQETIHDGVRWGWATTERFWKNHREGDVPVRGHLRTVQRTLFEDDSTRIS